LKDGDTFEVANVRMEFLLRDELSDAAAGSTRKFVLVLVAVAIVAYLIHRLRG